MLSGKPTAWRSCRTDGLRATYFLVLILAVVGLGGCGDGPDVSDCVSAPASPQNVLLGGSCGARITVRVPDVPAGTGGYFLRLQDGDSGDATRWISLHNPRRVSGGYSFDLPQVPRLAGLYELVGLPDSGAGGGALLSRDAVRIIN